MYVRKRKTLGTAVNEERYGGKDSYKNSSRDGAASVSQRNFQSHNIPERRNVSQNSDGRSNWSSQRSLESRPSETQRAPPFKALSQGNSSTRRDEIQRPPPFKPLLQGSPVARRDSFLDRRNNDFEIGRDYHAKNEDAFNNSRSSYGERHGRWESYDQRESANRGLHVESQRGFECPTVKDTMEKLFGSEFKYGSTPFANTGDERFVGGVQRGGNNMSRMNLDEISYSDRRDDSYYSDRREDSYYSDKRGYAYSDRRRDSSPERRGHSSYSERRGDSFPERGLGSYSGRRNDESSLDRGSAGYYQDRRDSDTYPARRYDFQSDRRGDNSYSDRGYASHRDRKVDDTYTDKRGSDYYPDRRGGGSYPDGRGSPYADGRGPSSYMGYERSNNLSYDQHKGASIPFENRGRVDNSHDMNQQRRVDDSYVTRQKQGMISPFENRGRVDNSHDMNQQRRVDDSYVSRQKQGMISHLDKPMGRSYSLEEDISYGDEKRRNKTSVGGQRVDEKPKGSNLGGDLKSPSKDEKQAAMGILKKVLAKQQTSKPRGRSRRGKANRDDMHNVEIGGGSGNRSAHLSKKVGVKDSFRQHYQNRKDKGKIRRTLPTKRPLDTASSPQNKKPRISVLSRLGPKLETAGKEVFSRLGPRSGNVKSRLGPRSVSGSLAGQTTKVTVDPAGPNKLSAKEIMRLGKRFKNLPVEVLSCSKCKQSEFPSVNKYLLHQVEEHHDQIDASFHKKIESLYKYLQCDAKLAYAREVGKVRSNKVNKCDVCDVSEYTNKPHLDIKSCKVVHDFAKPNKCCRHFGRFPGRSFFENHIHTLPHLVKKSRMFQKKNQMVIKNRGTFKDEKDKLELMKKAFRNGSSTVTNDDGSILKMNFRHEVLQREAKVYEQFGTVAVPEEVSSLLQAYEELADPLPVGKVLTQIKKLESKYYDPSNIHGKYHIVFETNFKCYVCGILLERSQQSLIDHCSTKEHYDNVVKERQKLREKTKEEKDEVMEAKNAVSEENNSSNDEVSTTIKEESVGVEDDGSEGDCNDVDIYGDHHVGKNEKQAQKCSVLDKKGKKATVESDDEEENEEAEEVEMDVTEEGEPSEEIDDELVEKDKQEDDDVDIYSDPYGGGDLLEGVEEKQEAGYDEDDDNAQEQEEEDNEEDATENDCSDDADAC